MSPNVRDALLAAGELQRFCTAQGWRFCFIGGIAVQRWGEPRFTHDADLTVLAGFGEEESFVGALLESFSARFSDERELAPRRRVVFLNSSAGVPIDLALGGLPFEEKGRRPSHSLARAEDINRISSCTKASPIET